MSGASNRALEVALVNNMPDQALAATDMQFARLVRAGAGDRDIRWRRYHLPAVERSETAQRYLARSHEDIDALYRRGADALIVTGAEPRAPRFDDEPYWPALAQLVDWARANTVSTIWSCLAAHAAVYRLDGIERQRMPEKLSGVYACQTTPNHWAAAPPRGVLTPHSRYNDLPADTLSRAGYVIAGVGQGVGVDSFWRREPSLFVFLQGHPEYDSDTLLKEYRRDVLRFLNDERATYPAPPAHFFSAATATKLDRLRGDFLDGRRESAESRLGEILSGEKCLGPWKAHAVALYREWLDLVSREYDALRNSA